MKMACIGAALTALVCLSACQGEGGGPNDQIGAGCLPGRAPAGAASGPATPDAMDFYLDVSQSSTNFGDVPGETPYRDLIGSLLALGGEVTSLDTFGFAERISAVDREVIVQAARGAVAPCGQACGFRETRLDDVLERLANAPDAPTSVIITDLWLDNSEIIGRGAMSLGGPIREILESGRAIGVLGVRAPYTRRVFDVPGAAGTTTLPAGAVASRPFFVLLVGEPGPVLWVRERIERDAFAQIGATQHHFTMFSPQARIGAPERIDLEPPEDPRIGAVDFVAYVEGDTIPSFRLNRRAAGNFRTDAMIEGVSESDIFAGPSAGLDSLGSQYGPALSQYALEAQFWTLSPPDPARACEPGAWVPIALEDTLRLVRRGADPAVVLDASHPDFNSLNRSDIVFGRYAVTAGALEEGGAPTDWMRAWSFTADQGPQLAASPPHHFPTLNVHEFAQLLETATAEHVRGDTLGYGSVLLKTE